MAGLKEIRTRIGTVKTTRQVTSAMKMIAAAKLKKGQDAILQIRPYANKLHDILVSISSNLNIYGEELVCIKPRDPEKVLVVLISSNNGLCGGFNINISKNAVELVRIKYGMQYKLGDVDFLCIGKQGERQVRQRGMNVVKTRHELYDNMNFENVCRVADEVIDDFTKGTYDRVELVYNQFKNAAMQNIVAEQYLPVPVEEKKAPDSYYYFIFEPSREQIIKEVIPRSLKIEFYRALLDSFAAEQGARMTAMHQATDNATELLKDLMLQYNKVRQTTITNEILEIVSGSEALRR
jgi:F-type H+-transporting ATPase subunit gamma